MIYCKIQINLLEILYIIPITNHFTTSVSSTRCQSSPIVLHENLKKTALIFHKNFGIKILGAVAINISHENIL